MTAQKGNSVVLNIGNGASPSEIFTAVGGAQLTAMSVDQTIIDASDVSSGAWRKVQSGSGVRSLIMRIRGVFEGSAAEEALRMMAFSGAANNFELHFGNGDVLSGSFVISAYERSGAHDDAEGYEATLQSVGAISFASA